LRDFQISKVVLGRHRHGDVLVLQVTPISRDRHSFGKSFIPKQINKIWKLERKTILECIVHCAKRILGFGLQCGYFVRASPSESEIDTPLKTQWS